MSAWNSSTSRKDRRFPRSWLRGTCGWVGLTSPDVGRGRECSLNPPRELWARDSFPQVQRGPPLHVRRLMLNINAGYVHYHMCLRLWSSEFLVTGCFGSTNSISLYDPVGGVDGHCTRYWLYVCTLYLGTNNRRFARYAMQHGQQLLQH